jgi:hypothetical protein
VDETGVPVVGAHVNADPAETRPGRVAIRSSDTDAEGRFVVNRLAFGKYKVFAKKEEAGYRDMSWSFYSNEVFPTVTLTPSAPAATLKIQVGRKSAVLTGSVTNAVTGAPINAGFKLARASSLEKWISTSMAPRYRVLLPPGTDVLVEVSAAGFKTWTLCSPLRLPAGAQMHLDIPLEPASHLEKEATKPAAANFLQQQARFDKFAEVFNNQRPHEALDMNVPLRSISLAPQLHWIAGHRLSAARQNDRGHSLWPHLSGTQKNQFQHGLRRSGRRYQRSSRRHLAGKLYGL